MEPNQAHRPLGGSPGTRPPARPTAAMDRRFRPRPKRAWLLGALLAIAGAACSAAKTPAPPPSAPPSVAAAALPAPAAASPSAALPSPGAAAVPSAAPGGGATGSVVVIVFENKEYGQVIGQADAPYINSLAQRYVLADRSYGVTHPSLPNYLSLVGGSTFGISSDCTDCFVDRPNLVDALEQGGRSWKAYMEDLPSPCFTGASAGGLQVGAGVSVHATYALKHDPFLYFDDVRDNPARCQRVVPLTQFSTDLASNSLPDFVWITPNLIHDMHDGTVADGDRWLAGFLPPLLQSPAFLRGGLVLITWDEGTTNQGCCGLAAGGQIPTLLLRPGGPHGVRLSQPVTHYDVLRTVLDFWHLPAVGQSGAAGVRSLVARLGGS